MMKSLLLCAAKKVLSLLLSQSPNDGNQQYVIIMDSVTFESCEMVVKNEDYTAVRKRTSSIRIATIAHKRSNKSKNWKRSRLLVVSNGNRGNRRVSLMMLSFLLRVRDRLILLHGRKD